MFKIAGDTARVFELHSLAEVIGFLIVHLVPESGMGKILEFDEAASRRLEIMYTTPDVVAQRVAAVRALGPGEGERILDIGAGNGFLTGEIGERVGAMGEVVGIDVSETMVGMAQARCADQPWVRFEIGGAVALPHLRVF